MSGYMDSSVRTGTHPSGSYPHASYHIVQGQMPSYAHVFQPAARGINESAPVSQGLLSPTLLTSQPQCPIQNVEKEPRTEEAALNDEKLETEDRGENLTYCGLDLTPFLPVALAVSTVLGALCMLLLQIPMLSRFTSLPPGALFVPMSALYILVLGSMIYSAVVDPGQMNKTRNTEVGNTDIEAGLPRRAHKSWLYPRPIRRYDHYCRWLQNVIGLLNHREFVLMVGGLVLIASIGIIADLWLAFLIAEKRFFGSEIIVACHCAYSVGLLATAWPILKIHVGFISRNELGYEWKNDLHYVADNTSQGDAVPVGSLETDEYNAIFAQDGFIYDPSKNSFDQGYLRNCCNFWCHPRWPPDSLGDF